MSPIERFEVREGLMRFRLGLRTRLVAIAPAGRMTRRGLPRNPLELADLARRYDHEAHAPFITAGMQRLLLAPFLFAARPRYPRCRATASSASMS